MRTGANSLGTEQPQRAAEHSTPSNAEVKMSVDIIRLQGA